MRVPSAHCCFCVRAPMQTGMTMAIAASTATPANRYQTVCPSTMTNIVVKKKNHALKPRNNSSNTELSTVSSAGCHEIAYVNKVASLLYTHLDLHPQHVWQLLDQKCIQNTIMTVPHYESHLTALIYLLTMHIGVDKAALAPLIQQHPESILSRAPYLGDDLRSLRRAFAFHFDMYVKDSADEFPAAWREAIARHPRLLLLCPHKAESILRWWSTLVNKGNIPHAMSVRFVRSIVEERPEMLNLNVRILQHQTNQAWHLAKQKMKINTCARRGFLGESTKARFVLGLVAQQAGLDPNIIFQGF